MTFRHVVFIQEHEADEPLKILDERGREAVVEYLAQWDRGEGETREKSSAGTHDRQFQVRRYLVSYNLGLPYIGMEEVVS